MKLIIQTGQEQCPAGGVRTFVLEGKQIPWGHNGASPSSWYIPDASVQGSIPQPASSLQAEKAVLTLHQEDRNHPHIHLFLGKHTHCYKANTSRQNYTNGQLHQAKWQPKWWHQRSWTTVLFFCISISSPVAWSAYSNIWIC